MSMEEKSRFDGFETNEETGEVIIPPATVGVVPSEAENKADLDGDAAQNAEYIPVQMEEEELPELQFEFDFGEEEFADPEQGADEDFILKSIDEALAAQMAVSLGPVEEVTEEKPVKKKGIWRRIPLWCRIAMISLCSICLILVLLVGTKPGRKLIYGMVVGYVDDKIGREDPVTPGLTPPPGITEAPLPTQGVQDPDDGQITPGPTSAPAVEPRHEEYVYNILLIGVEALPQFGGERSDTMILVSVNSRDKKIYMTSLMRDMYVQIPGHSDNRLNSAYSYGGPQLLIDAVEKNLEVKIDGYVKVGFDSFEWIIDRLGGVEITLTAEEAEYLRKTNYISKPEYRTVVAGTQVLNGNQALGYCRVRKVATANGTSSDFGRTERQRTVLTKLFNKYKETGIFTLLSVLNDCLPQVVTNISKSDMQDLMETVIEDRVLNLETFRIPVSGSFSDVYVGKDLVMQVNLPKNVEELHKKIFGSVR